MSAMYSSGSEKNVCVCVEREKDKARGVKYYHWGMWIKYI